MNNLFQSGDFVLSSGIHSGFKIDCDALTYEDLDCVAWLLSLHVPSFGQCEGVPTGGLRLAKYMQKYRTVGPLLIVDDVFTTGASMERYRAEQTAIGAVIFARTQTPDWIVPLFQMGVGEISDGSGKGRNEKTQKY